MKGFIVTIIILFQMSGFCQTESGTGISFNDSSSLDEVLAKAKREKKYIFIDAYTTWCGPCKKMDKEVFADDAVGRFFNRNFISLRLQMDTSRNDSKWIKNRYLDAKRINDEYGISGYPSFLFFNPEGNLVNRGLGFHEAKNFIKLAKGALDPQTNENFSLMEQYKKGDKKYDKLNELAMYAKSIGDHQLAREIAMDYVDHVDRPSLLSPKNILIVNDIIGDAKLARSLAIEYKRKYLDTATQYDLCTWENLIFIDRFSDLINSKDSIFFMCYWYPKKVDSAVEIDGWAKAKVEQTITHEELETKLLRDGKAPIPNAKWKKIERSIKNKYPNADAKYIVLNFSTSYYYKEGDYVRWANRKDRMIRLYPPKNDEVAVFIELNIPAWGAFLYSKNKNVLRKALRWSNLSIELAEGHPNFQCLDTKANLLYKLGRVKQALAVQEKAISLSKLKSEDNGRLTKELMEAFSQMKAGKPTYVNAGAVWIMLPFLLYGWQ